MNLTEVYLDAVFHPALAHDERIFFQEGRHLHLETKDANLEYQGVVLNEMKGALSDPS